ncbi:Cof-type HAD-IIB family hydrolase [Anaerococcus sp. AGMB09787]|uniref:Cof-type HAD-IIB family hydrolase n=1 Tax=Anaerococcus sp. AGMB09787 TaxID=2922869 RepID=UPI001FAEC697|nr:Cof-type HAD-IIB family hydrolase [Anaerococcus sp. AGMB09787]
MKKDIKLIVFDVDGTLVNDNKEILDETVEVVEALKNKGIKIILNSGRTFNGMWRMRQKLGLMAYDDYSICGTGAYIRRNADGKALLANPLDEDDYNKIVAMVDGFDVQVAVHTMNILYLNEEEPNEAFILDQKQVQMPWMKFEKFSDIEESVSRIGIEGDPEVLDQISDKYMDKLTEDYMVMRNESYLIEILNKNSGKEKSLASLCDILGVAMDDIMYFGDGLNDAKSIDLVGVGIAMDNAHPAAKDAADYVIGSNEEPALAEFLRRYFDIDD